MKPNIYLIGFMGSGKSTIGRKIAKILKRPFVDSDDFIENRAGCTISEIFAQQGEAEFRRLERECVLELSGQPGIIMALGGGAILDPDSWLVLTKTGVTVWLDWPFETLYQRISKKTNRPLAQGQPDEKRVKLQNMYDRRIPYYSRAGFQIQSQGAETKEETANQILSTIGVME
ncbi:shikimate kinase [bacterium]|nr:shikimate kinase [bacterium]